MATAVAQAAPPTLTPSSVAFGSTTVGERSAPQILIFAAGAPVTLSSVTVTGPFSRTGGTCAAGTVTAECTVAVAFAPTAAGSQTGAVVAVWGRGESLRSILSGSGAAAATTSTTAAVTTTTGAQVTTVAPRPSTTTTPPTPPITGRPATSAPETSTAAETTVPVAVSTTSVSTTTTAPAVRRGATLDARAAGGRRSGPPGIGLTVTGSGYPPGGATAPLAAPLRAQPAPACGTVHIFIDSHRIGATRPDAAGRIHKGGISVPAGVDPGPHQLTSSCRSAGSPVLAAATFEVTSADVHRSALATSMPHADQVDFGPGPVLLSLLVVAGLLVLIAFPAELFNTTLEEHYDEVRGWFGRPPRPVAGRRAQGPLLAVFLLLSGPLWFAMQPESALDAATAWGALGLSVATGFVVLASDLPEVRHVRRRYGERAVVVALPGALVVAVACVVLSRAVHFQPGYFYGLLGGLALSRTLARDESGRLAARTAAFLLGLSLASWLALLPVSAAAAESGTTLGTIFVENVLAGIFWAALDSLVIAMLPMRLLLGAKVMGWSRGAWVGLYGLTALGFVHILLRPSTGYVSNTEQSAPYVVVGLFVAFAAFSLGFWAYFRFRRSPAEAPADEVEGAPGPVPPDLLVVEGVGAGEIEGGAVGPVEAAVDGAVGGEDAKAEDGDVV